MPFFNNIERSSIICILCIKIMIYENGQDQKRRKNNIECFKHADYDVYAKVLLFAELKKFKIDRFDNNA